MTCVPALSRYLRTLCGCPLYAAGAGTCVCLSLIRRVWLFLYAAGNKQPANGFTLPVLYFTSCENPARIQVRLFQTRVQVTLADNLGILGSSAPLESGIAALPGGVG